MKNPDTMCRGPCFRLDSTGTSHLYHKSWLETVRQGGNPAPGTRTWRTYGPKGDLPASKRETSK